MKTVIIFRHAKSSWKDPQVNDLDRPLNKRGRRDAPAAGRRLQYAGFRFDVLYCSPAQRALETAHLITSGMGESPTRIEVVDELYEATCPKLVRFIRSRSDALETIGLVTHNPEATETANRLGSEETENLSTSAVYAIEFQVNRWRDLERGQTVLYDYPKKHT